MGSSGMKRKKRHRLPKVVDDSAAWGTVPLGQDPPMGPWGPFARVQAYGNISRAWNHGSPRQRKAARVVLAVVSLPTAAVLITWLADTL